jgi:hypothetical protein
MPADEESRPVRFRSYSPRVEVHEDARLISASGESCEVILADISREGFRIKYDGCSVRPGTATLRVQRYGDMPIEVRWIRGKEAGGVFLDSAPEIL